MTNSHRISRFTRGSSGPENLRFLSRALGMAALLLGVGVAPAVASASGDASAREQSARGPVASVDGAAIVLHRTAEPDLHLVVEPGTRVAMNGRSASVSDLQEGEEVRASYQESNGVATATRIDAEGDDGGSVQLMSPDDPEFAQLHQGG
jgi:hypothetical protein